MNWPKKLIEAQQYGMASQAFSYSLSHLIAQNYSHTEILTECVTYAAAGMVTTREFMSVAAWHFLEHPELRARYQAAPEEERLEILHETLRLEPVVGNLYRRATADIVVESEGEHVTIPAGDLVNIHIDATNTDQAVIEKDSLVLCPGRELQGDRIPSMIMSFGDGHHRCPGSYLAIQETDIFLHRLLAVENLRIEQPPALNWNELTTGYEIRKFMLECDLRNSLQALGYFRKPRHSYACHQIVGVSLYDGSKASQTEIIFPRYGCCAPALFHESAHRLLSTDRWSHRRQPGRTPHAASNDRWAQNATRASHIKSCGILIL